MIQRVRFRLCGEDRPTSTMLSITPNQPGTPPQRPALFADQAVDLSAPGIDLKHMRVAPAAGRIDQNPKGIVQALGQIAAQFGGLPEIGNRFRRLPQRVIQRTIELGAWVPGVASQPVGGKLVGSLALYCATRHGENSGHVLRLSLAH